jgi:hypothetical protein
MPNHDFERRFFPVDGREFITRSGTWRCELNGPVDVSGPDRRTFFLRFTLLQADARWKGGVSASERTLELRTSLASFHNIGGKETGYANWLLLVVEGSLDSDKTDDVRVADEIERG